MQNSVLNWLICFQPSEIAHSLNGGLTSFFRDIPFGECVCFCACVCVCVFYLQMHVSIFGSQTLESTRIMWRDCENNFLGPTVNTSDSVHLRLRMCFWSVPCSCANSLQLFLTHCDLMDCSPPGSSVHGIFQARILEWVAMPSSRGSSQPKDQTLCSEVSYLGKQVLYYLHHLGSPVSSCR